MQTMEEESSFRFPIEAGKIREFAQALLDDNPIYRDLEYAKSQGLPNVPAPPTFSVVSSFFRQHDGGQSNRSGFDMRFALHGEQEFEYFRPIFAGDVLTVRPGAVRRYERTGRRGGKMNLYVTETVYENQDGDKVLVSRLTLIETEGRASD